MSKKRKYIILICLAIITTVAVSVRSYDKSQYPYGHTHCCSKILYPYLFSYAAENDGNFPNSDDPHKLALTQLIDSGSLDLEFFDLIIGKAGDLDTTEKFYAKHGYIKPEHNS
ncbi:MAG: hypothetical protein ACI9FG_001020 [Crocinitomicaceae bacterium]|jgi:hypothetical protein